MRGVEPALRRVVTSLIDNAFGHTAPGGHITVTLSRTGAMVELEAHDDGVGLDPRDAERPFTRSPAESTERAAGSASGWPLREVVDGHGGTIEVDGPPGAGAAFTVRLPAERTAPAGQAEVNTSPPRPVAARRSPSR